MGTVNREKIKPVVRKIVVSNEGHVLDNFWVESSVSGGHKSDHKVRTKELVEQSKEMVCIMTPSMAVPWLLHAIEDAESKRNIRSYGLVADLNDLSKSPGKVTAIRERKGLRSTIILSDPMSKDPRGIFFPSGVEETAPSFMIELTMSQIEESFAQFCHFFWEAKGRELFDGKMRPSLDVLPARPPVKQDLGSTFRQGTVLETPDVLEQLWCDSLKSAKSHGVKPRLLVIPLGAKENAPDLLESSEIVEAVDRLSIDYVRTGHGSVLFTESICFRLTEDQQDEVENGEYGSRWRLERSIAIGGIKGRIRSAEDAKGTPFEIPEIAIVDVPPGQKQVLESGSFTRWQETEKTEFTPPGKDRPLARKVEYRFAVDPPYLPGGLVDHTLVHEWKELKDILRSSVDEVVQRSAQVERTLNMIQSAQKGVDDPNSRMRELMLKTISSIKDKAQMATALRPSLDGLGDEMNSSRKTVDAIMSLLGEFNDSVAKAQTELKSSLSSYFEGKLAKLDSNQRKKAEKAAKKVMSDVESWKPAKLPSTRIPESGLPSTGKLLMDPGGKVTYLAISYIDEIEPSKLEVSRFEKLSPILVVSK